MKRIRTLIQMTRLKQGRELEELASFLEIESQTLIDFETRGAEIEAETLFGLVNALNIDPEEFLKLLNADEPTSDVELLRARLRKL